jgi:hypothetical protein
MRFQILTTASMKMISFCDIAPCSLALLMDSLRTSETSVYFNDSTQRNIPEGYHLQVLSYFEIENVAILNTQSFRFEFSRYLGHSEIFIFTFQ